MKIRNVSQAAAEVDQINRGRSVGASVRDESLGMGQEGAEEAKGDLQGQGSAPPASSTCTLVGKIRSGLTSKRMEVK